MRVRKASHTGGTHGSGGITAAHLSGTLLVTLLISLPLFPFSSGIFASCYAPLKGLHPAKRGVGCPVELSVVYNDPGGL